MSLDVFDVMHALSASTFASGSSLAQRFNVSRGRIWQAIEAARALGINVQSVHGRGYRLAHEIDWLDAKAIAPLLSDHAAQYTPHVLTLTDSTNAQLLAAATQQTPHGYVLAAEAQTAGRGRRGREWLTVPGGSLAFSVLWRFPFGATQLAGLSLAVGVGIVRVLHRLGLENARLKWPNDILVDNHKLGGILIETQGDALGPVSVVVGVGLNIQLPQLVPATIAQAITDMVSHLPARPARNALLALLLNELAQVAETFSEAGFAAFAAEWQTWHAWQNKTVQITHPNGRTHHGVLRGIDTQGALRIAHNQTEEAVLTADITLLPTLN